MNFTFAKTCPKQKGPGALTSLSALALIVCLTGCISQRPARQTIDIDSDPQGVRVEVNGEDLGTTPTQYTVQPDGKGNFEGSWGYAPSILFVAYPPEGWYGLHKQKKMFSPSGLMETGDRVPEKIFFDLYQESGN